MPVAIRLVEVLTLVTLLGILTGLSLLVIILQRVVYMTLLLLTVSQFLYFLFFNKSIATNVINSYLLFLISATNIICWICASYHGTHNSWHFDEYFIFSEWFELRCSTIIQFKILNNTEKRIWHEILRIYFKYINLFTIECM